MTIAELHSNEELRQHEFPVSRDKIFLAHAGVCAIPRRVAERVAHYAMTCTLGDQETLLPYFEIQQTRALAAQLIGAQPDELPKVGKRNSRWSIQQNLETETIKSAIYT